MGMKNYLKVAVLIYQIHRKRQLTKRQEAFNLLTPRRLPSAFKLDKKY